MSLLPQEIIAAKRDGVRLPAADIRAFIAGITDETVSPAQAAAFAMAVFFQDMDIGECVALTEAMRDSGTTLDWSDFDGPIVDKHSTGGVGDNVSLMLAPILAACGVYVPMISGRGLGHTGGTLDKLDAIPGYETAPDNTLFRKVVREAGCAIIGQTADLAPADKILYAIRDVTGTVPSIPLITASILSKKLAAGLGALALDVKTGSGAFMQTLDRSRQLADSLVQVANSAGLKATALITDMNEPLASATGNALEVRNAVDFLSGAKRDARLRQVTLALATEVLELIGRSDAATEVERALDSGAATEHFSRMVALLGGPSNLVDNIDAHLPAAAIVRDVLAPEAGTVTAIDARGVGMAVVVLGGGRRQPGDALDYSVGFDRLVGLGTRLEKDQPLARIHARDEAEAEEAIARLLSAYEIGPGPTIPHPVIEARVSPPAAGEGG